MESGQHDRASSAAWVTLAAMTLANSMILVDQTAVPLATPHAIADLGASLSESQWLLTANVLPLAAFMVLGGKLGDLLGLRRVFLFGAALFGCSTALAGLAQNLPWMIAARASQGTGAALMMPTAVAIVSAVFPASRRGTALGVLAGGSAFFAALGPVFGGLLASIDWRLVFLVNVPLAATTVVLTLTSTPALAAAADTGRRIDYPGVITFALGIGAVVFGLSQGGRAGGTPRRSGHWSAARWPSWPSCSSSSGSASRCSSSGSSATSTSSRRTSARRSRGRSSSASASWSRSTCCWSWG